MKKLFLLLLLLLMGCSVNPPSQESTSAPLGVSPPPLDGSLAPSPPASSTTGETAGSSVDAAKPERRGLGTAWGETRYSGITKTPFIRTSNSPLIQSAIYYNDSVGIRNVLGYDPIPNNQLITLGNYQLSLSAGLTNEYGSPLLHTTVNNRHYVVGEKNDRYSITIQNHSGARLEIVLSVDGLDVMDGKSASLSKRGYIIEPFGQLKVDGFRQSDNTVAAFRFSSVFQGYAQQKYGNSSNVGVIGIAAFAEQGTNWYQLDEIRRRQQANPFPNSGYATPP